MNLPKSYHWILIVLSDSAFSFYFISQPIIIFKILLEPVGMASDDWRIGQPALRACAVALRMPTLQALLLPQPHPSAFMLKGYTMKTLEKSDGAHAVSRISPEPFVEVYKVLTRTDSPFG